MPRTSQALRFELADPADLDTIRQINHRTFAEEIPQHRTTPDGRLVDPFERESTFIVARAEREIVGMIALRDVRPFSLDDKVRDLDRHLPRGRRACEIRLLSVDPVRRRGIVLRGLLARLVRECDARGLDLAVLSATTRQLRLYRHLGCVPFAAPVGTADAAFQPMYVTRESLLERVGALLDAEPRCFMTGPVSLSPAVRARLAQPLVSHRSEAFACDLARLRDKLGALTGVGRAAIFAGSGTLANDVVARQLAAHGGNGLVIANGEFGDRLAAQAARHALPHAVLRRPWGAPVEAEAIDQALHRTRARWVWAVHSETSTGMLNDLDTLRALARHHGARVALDAASSIGATPVNLAGVDWAATVSGKALGGVAGLAIVLAAEPANAVPPGTPTYLDLGRHLAEDSVPFTQSSLLVGALAEALASTDWTRRLTDISRADRVLRERLMGAGIRPLVPRRLANPAVATWVVPSRRRSADVGMALERKGFQVSWQSAYLQERGWIQTALFGAFEAGAVPSLARTMAEEMGNDG